MQTQLPNSNAQDRVPPLEIDASKILESVVSELEALRSLSDRPRLVELHGALFLYALEGRAELIPSVGFPIGRRRVLEARVVWSARRLATLSRGATTDQAMNRAADTIRELLYLIDPELASFAA
jgi:hypothetical protein